MGLRVICAGDIHIGRRSSKVAESFRTTTAWNDIVDTAIAHEADLLAVSGDVIDKESKSYESLGPMQDGLRRLDDAGIDTVAVAGNHDHDVLPRIASITGTDRFHLLGRNGTWERFSLMREGAVALHVDGWSFPTEHVPDNPLHSYPVRASDQAPVMGLLHADIGNVRSPYAPVMVDELWAQPVDLWLLGHIHAAHTFHGPRGQVAMYPGSPYAMDPGEPGTHGIWLVEFSDAQPPMRKFLPISPVHYVEASVDLTDVVDEGGFQHALAEALQRVGESAIQEHTGGMLAVVSARLRLTGRSPAHHSIPVWARKVETETGSFRVGAVSIEIDRVVSDVRPAIDLDRLANGNTPVAETARLLLALREDDLKPEYADLVQRVEDDVVRIHRHTGYASLAQNERENEFHRPDTETARSLLMRQGWRLLSELVAQKEPT